MINLITPFISAIRSLLTGMHPLFSVCFLNINPRTLKLLSLINILSGTRTLTYFVRNKICLIS